MSNPRAFVTWFDLPAGAPDGMYRSEIHEILDFEDNPLMGRRALCVGSGKCPLWFDVDRLEVQP